MSLVHLFSGLGHSMKTTFPLIDDLHLQKGKCVMKEHDFQSTSSFSGTVSSG